MEGMTLVWDEEWQQAYDERTYYLFTRWADESNEEYEARIPHLCLHILQQATSIVPDSQIYSQHRVRTCI